MGDVRGVGVSSWCWGSCVTATCLGRFECCASSNGSSRKGAWEQRRRYGQNRGSEPALAAIQRVVIQVLLTETGMGDLRR